MLIMVVLAEPGHDFMLTLGDGSQWILHAADDTARESIAQFSRATRLKLYSSEAGKAHEVVFAPCIGNSLKVPDDLVDCLRLVELSTLLARAFVPRGGVLLHGALAEQEGRGVLLAAPGGTGKTTASNRLAPPWRSLSDDLTLVLQDKQGRWWAHPWPTWGRFAPGGPGGAWDVQHAVPLHAMFYLAQAPAEKVEPLGAGQAIARLVQSAEQAAYYASIPGSPSEETSVLRQQIFDLLCNLARAVPAFVLHLSLTGAFWVEIERALGWNRE